MSGLVHGGDVHLSQEISDPPGIARCIQIKGYCVERQEKYYFGTSIDKFGNKLTPTEGATTVSYEDVFVKSISLLMTVLKFDLVFFLPVHLSIPEDNINGRSQKKQKL